MTSLGHTGGGIGAKVVRRTSTAALIAGALLGVVYVGLGLIGHVIPNAQSYTDGASLLADAARSTMGWPGHIVFGLIVLTACMTTAVGLIAATSEFFNRLMPSISYRAWMILFTLISFVLASAGLSSVLAIAVPIITFLYPDRHHGRLHDDRDPSLPPDHARDLDLPAGRVDGRRVVGATRSRRSASPPTASTPCSMWRPLQANQLGWIVPTLCARNRRRLRGRGAVEASCCLTPAEYRDQALQEAA